MRDTTNTYTMLPNKSATRTGKRSKKTDELTTNFLTGTIEVVKLSREAHSLEKAYPGDACYDLYANESHKIPGFLSAAVGTGLAIAIPPGYFGKIYTRSGNAVKGFFLTVAGVIDSGYRGEVKVVMHNKTDYPHDIVIGDKIAQLAIHKVEALEVVEVTEFTNKSERNEKGFGSSGK